MLARVLFLVSLFAASATHVPTHRSEHAGFCFESRAKVSTRLPAMHAYFLPGRPPQYPEVPHAAPLTLPTPKAPNTLRYLLGTSRRH